MFEGLAAQVTITDEVGRMAIPPGIAALYSPEGTKFINAAGKTVAAFVMSEAYALANHCRAHDGLKFSSDYPLVVGLGDVGRAC